MSKLINKWDLIKHENHAKKYSPEMLVIGKGYILDAKEIDSDELIEEIVGKINLKSYGLYKGEGKSLIYIEDAINIIREVLGNI